MEPKRREILLSDIKVGEFQTRMELDVEKVDDLAVSIQRIGLLSPLIVAKEGQGFVLVAGHHRYLAVQKLGWKKVTCCLCEGPEASRNEMAIAENLFRMDLTPVETASAVGMVIEQGIMDVPELARAMHRSEHWVSRQLQIVTWPSEVLQAVHDGKLSVSAAENIALIPDVIYRAFLLKQAEDNGATARTTAAWLQGYRALQPPEEAVNREPVSLGDTPTPAVPQAPCLVCSGMFRTDQLAYVLICPPCVGSIRGAAARS